MNRHHIFVCLLFFALLLPACAGTKERETERILLLHKRYSGSIIRVDMRMENGGFAGGTAFYAGQGTEFITARHVLMCENEEGIEYPIDRIMLHIPSCETGFKANMDDVVTATEDKKYDINFVLNDWANFVPDTDRLSRRPLIYDPKYPLHNGQRVFIAGYPHLNRDHNYIKVVPVESLANRSFFVYATEHKFATVQRSEGRKINVAFLPSLGDIDRFKGMSGGPVLVWDTKIEDFIAIGILVNAGHTSSSPEKPILYFIRPKIPSITSDPEIN